MEAQQLSDLISQQLATSRTETEAARATVDSLRKDLARLTSQTQEQASQLGLQRAERDELQLALTLERDAKAQAEARAAKLQTELRLSGEELAAAEQRLERHLQRSSARERQLDEKAQMRRDVDEAVIAGLQKDVELMRTRLADARCAPSGSSAGAAAACVVCGFPGWGLRGVPGVVGV